MRRVLVVLSCLLAALAGAQTRDFVGGRLAAPPTLDGKIDAEEYKDAIRFEGLVDADTGGAGAEGGRFYLGYDDKYVYFAAQLVDTHPGSIQATEFRTNASLDGNDSLALALDPFDNLADFNRFTMNPRGATNLQIAGGRAAKREWLGDFAAKGRITAEGWEVEARIPWSIMRGPGKGPHDLRFNVFRNHRRLQRTFAWAQVSSGLVQNYGRWKAVDLPAAEPPRLLALPYVYGGLDQKTGLVANAGVDLRYGLTRDLDLVGTINPDFRNVERGILSLDFSYFERLADESRPFFLEGGSYFEGFGDQPIFASQRIGNFDAGTKVFGKLDPRTDLGVLATADFGNNDAVVARIRRQTGPRTNWAAQYAGGGVDGKRNDAVAGLYGMGVGAWGFTAQLSATHDEAEGDGHRAVVNGEYNRDRTDFFWRYVEVSPHFFPRLGFAPQTDLRGVDAFVSKDYAAPKKGFSHYGVEAGGAYKRSYDLDKPFNEDAQAYPYFILNDGTHMYGVLHWSRFFGGSDDQTYGLSLDRPAGNPYRNWGVSYSSGTRAGQPYRDASAGFAYRPLPTLQLLATVQRTTFLGDTQTQTIVSANYDLDQYHSIGGRSVTGPNVSNFYLSFRQSGNRGAEYYLILGDPNAAHFRTSLILKAVFPVSFKI